jgi:hypothetical protein
MLVYQHPGLQGLEIWHGLTRHTTLYQLRDDKSAYFAGLSDFLRALHAGTAETAGGNSLAAAIGFQKLILTGGEAAAASAVLDCPHELVNPGPHAARSGAEAIWHELGWRRPLAIDLGQSRLKYFTPEASGVIERDESLLPFGKDALTSGEGRARLRDFIRPVLIPDRDGILLALPAEITSDGLAEPSTYPGLFGPIDPIFESLFPDTAWAVCNDALLAARGYPPAAREKTLVLTLGFGVGAALWY